MFEKPFLSLSGYGRLQEIGYDEEGDVCITLQLINECNGLSSDDLWIVCQVNMCKFPEIADLENYLAKGKLITVKFDAQYLGFQQCYAGMSENDPRFIVHLQGKLLNIHEYYIETDNKSSQHNHAIENHIVSQTLRA
ncbi:MAG: hypothetical protein ABI370_08555 [Gammaproteobacteria bacterium]